MVREVKDMLTPEWIGKQFYHYGTRRIHTIIDMYTCYSHYGHVLKQGYVVEWTDSMDRTYQAEIALSSIAKSVNKYGWVI